MSGEPTVWDFLNLCLQNGRNRPSFAGSTDFPDLRKGAIVARGRKNQRRSTHLPRIGQLRSSLQQVRHH
jgi:hypothetical protein